AWNAQHEVVRRERPESHERGRAQRELTRVAGENVEADGGERKNQERNQDAGDDVRGRDKRNDDERGEDDERDRDLVLQNREDRGVRLVGRLELAGFTVKHLMGPHLEWVRLVFWGWA